MLFSHLHVHSFFSFLESPASPEMLCEKARALGYKSLALTDTNGLYGAIRFYKAAIKNKLHPIFGVMLTASLPALWRESYAVVLAKDGFGYSELCRLITKRQLDKSFDLAQDLARASEHVAVLAGNLDLAKSIKALGKKSGLYLEVVDHSQYGDFGKTALRIQQAAGCNIPAVFSNQLYFAEKNDHYIHKACRAIGCNETLDRLDENQVASSQAYLKSSDEMQDRFGQFEAVWQRTQDLAESCHGEPSLGKMRFPKYPFAKKSGSFSFLSDLCYAGLRNRYGNITSEALTQLSKELTIIEQRHYSDYFLIVWDIVQEAGRRGIPTVGRGSAANSLVSYSLELTHVDPLKYDLFFERFLNPEREDPPDIDIDFPWDQRDEMLNYAYARFGKKNVAMLCTIVCLHARSAIREAGRVMGLTEDELSAFSKRLPYGGKVDDLSNIVDRYPEARKLPFKEEPWVSIIKLAACFDGLPRHLSVHPGGIIILPDAISNVVPKQMSEKGVEVTQYDMNAAEASGFIKIDLLGQRGLSVIRDVAKLKKVDWTKIDPLKDEATKAMMREGRTMGCFYVESPGMRLLLKKMNCDTFEMLTAASSAIRPGVSDSGMRKMFVERHLGLEPVTYAHPVMKQLLKATYGVMIFQEDVIQVVHNLAGMSLGEADKLRRCMGFKHHLERITDYKERFMHGALERGASLDAAQEIWRQIESFAGFAFCKAHSASYAQLSFQAAYLKAHYPAEFMAAVLSNQGGFYGSCAYLEEARRIGLSIEGPDINKSIWQYTGQSGKLRVGLLAIEGLSFKESQVIIRSRENGGVFKDIKEFINRTGFSLEKIEVLINSGACDCLSASRVGLYWQQIIYNANQQEHVLSLPLTENCLLPDLAESSHDDKMLQAFKQLGLSPKAHPLMQYRYLLSKLIGQGMICASELKHYAGKKVFVCGWLVTSKGAEVRKTGERMKFLTLEDFTAIYEVVLFPKVYAIIGSKLWGRGPYLIEGVVDDDHGGLTITAQRLERLDKCI